MKAIFTGTEEDLIKAGFRLYIYLTFCQVYDILIK